MGVLRRITEDYRLDKLAHSSDAGSVFCAIDLRSGETVAVKLIFEVDETSQEQREVFERFAEALRSLHHPGVPRTLDFGFTTAGTAFLVTEYCNGVSLEHFEGSAPQQLVALLLQVAEALEALAAQGIRHGKVRADNVLVLPAAAGAEGGDGSERIKLLGLGAPASFGVADGGAADRRALAELTCRMLGASYDAAAPAPQVALPASAAKLEDPAILGSWLEAALRRPDQGTDAREGASGIFRRALGGAGQGAAAGVPIEPRHEPVAPQRVRSPVPRGPVERTVVLGRAALRLAAEATAPDTDETEARVAGGQPAAILAGELPAVPAAPGSPRGALAARVVEQTQRISVVPAPAPPAAQEPPVRPVPPPTERIPTAGKPAERKSGSPVLTEALPVHSAAPAGPDAPPPPAPAPAVPTAEPLVETETPAALAASSDVQTVRWPPVGASAPPAAGRPDPVQRPLRFPIDQLRTGTAPPAPSPTAGEILEDTVPRFQAQRQPSAAAMGTAPAGVAERKAEPPPSAPPEPPVAPAAPAPAVLTRSPSTGARAGPRRWWVPAILAAAIAVLGLGIALLVSHGRTPRPAAPIQAKVAAAPPHPRPVPPATPAPAPVNPQIELAEAYLASGNEAGARQALQSIPPEQQAAFSAAERDRFQRASTALEHDRREQLVKDLVDGFGKGNLGRLNEALASAKGMADLPAPIQQDLDRAKRAVALAARLNRAQRSRNYAEVFTLAAQLQQVLPASDRGAEAREQAARALEAGADAAVEAGQFDSAQTSLESLRAAWPDRPQLAERLARVGAQRQADAQLEAVLAATARAEHASQPLQGLELLAGAKPNARFADRFRQQKDRLSELLARLDKDPPRVALRESKLEYEKGKPARVQLRVTDDFRVKSVEGWARPEGGSYQSVPVRHDSGADYTVEIPESVHGNKPIELYVTATDYSGHQGALGSAEQPIKVKKKGWFSKLLGRDE